MLGLLTAEGNEVTYRDNRAEHTAWDTPVAIVDFGTLSSSNLLTMVTSAYMTLTASLFGNRVLALLSSVIAGTDQSVDAPRHTCEESTYSTNGLVSVFCWIITEATMIVSLTDERRKQQDIARNRERIAELQEDTELLIGKITESKLDSVKMQYVEGAITFTELSIRMSEFTHLVAHFQYLMDEMSMLEDAVRELTK